MAAVLGNSPHLQTLVQRKRGLQKPEVRQLSRSPQPVIQRKTEIEYKTQQVGYQDAGGQAHGEIVGHVADAWIDVTDPVVGAEPDSQKQQKPMYDRLKTVYGTSPFIRGHLLNGNLGGVGEVYNLFPITSHANGEHKRTAEGRLKKYTRAELQAKKDGLKGPYFIHYRVTAVPSNGSDLTANAYAEFRCEMVGAHSLQDGGHAETWVVPSQPGAKVVATGERSESKDYANTGLGSFGSQGKGESAQTLGSRMRSTVNGWRGDLSFKFATGGLGTHVELAKVKEKYLEELETELEKVPLYEEHLFDALDRAKELFADAHDQTQLDQARQQVTQEILAWGLNKRKEDFLRSLRYWLHFVDILDQDKEQVYQQVVKDITPVASIATFEQNAGEYVNMVTQQVKQREQQLASH